MIKEKSQKETIKTFPVYRSLSEPTYLFRKKFLKLTDAEVVICILVFLLAMIILEVTPYGNEYIFGFIPLDPTAFFAAGLLTAEIFTLFHILSPEGNTIQVMRGLYASKNLAPSSSTPDRYWLPVDHRRYLGVAAKKRDENE